MKNKIELLSEALDQLNAGNNPEPANDKETDGLLEIAVLLRKADLPAAPPEHLLTATVQRAADGLLAGKKRGGNSWLFTGALSAAAALLIFMGIHGFPSVQKVSPVVTPSAQSEPVLTQNDPPAAPDAPLPQIATETTAVKPPPATAKSRPPAKIRLAPEQPAAPLNKAAPPMASKAIPPISEATLVQLPGRKPEAIRRDPVTGIVQQFFDRGTLQELVVTQKIKPKASGTASIPKYNRQAEEQSEAATDSTVRKSFVAVNRITVVILDQEITLEGRQSVRELTELSRNLKFPGSQPH